MPRTLYTIGISHFCEKARWALDRAGLPFEEKAYAPGVHVWPVRRAGGTSTPLLVDGDVVVTDSTDILDHVQRHPQSTFRPWPDGPAGDDARALEATFDAEIGPHLRRWLYSELLPHREATVAMFASRSPASQRWWFSGGFRVLRLIIRRQLKIDPVRAERSRERVDAALLAVEARLADGRRYLTGDTFTGADIAFASLVAPAVLPDGYLPIAPSALPPVLQDAVAAARARPAGKFALRMWAEERAPR